MACNFGQSTFIGKQLERDKILVIAIFMAKQVEKEWERKNISVSRERNKTFKSWHSYNERQSFNRLSSPSQQQPREILNSL